VERLKTAASLSAFDPATLYGGGAEGYIDYPTLAESSTRHG
jgi:N-ethylmaleimide reductase